MVPEGRRERRRSRASAGRSTPRVSNETLKRGGIALVAILVLAGGAYAILTAPQPEQVHDHATFLVFVNGTNESFNHPQFDLANTGFEPAHIHIQEDGGKNIHMEGEFRGGVPTATMSQFFGSLGITFQKGKLVLAPVQGNGTYVDDGTAQLSFLVNHANEGWKPQTAWGAYVIRGCDQILVSYGPNGQNLTAEEGAVPQPDYSTNCK